ncbi:MAG: sigma-E factor regulatory protein RseB domain-containing protein [Planctomycetota bacterium]
MARRIRILAGVLMTCAFSSAVALGQDEVAKIEQEIIKNWQKHRSMIAKVTMTGDRTARGQKVTSRAEGTYEWLRKSDAALVRLDVRRTLEVESGDQKKERSSHDLTVFDGQYMYTYTEQAGTKEAVKAKLDPKLGADVRALFEALHEQDNLSLLPAERVADKDAHVIQAMPKKPRPDGLVYRYYFSKADGALLKMALCDRDGNAVETTTFTDIKFDLGADPGRFVFQAPPGVKVVDLTQQAP